MTWPDHLVKTGAQEIVTAMVLRITRLEQNVVFKLVHPLVQYFDLRAECFRVAIIRVAVLSLHW